MQLNIHIAIKSSCDAIFVQFTLTEGRERVLDRDERGQRKKKCRCTGLFEALIWQTCGCYFADGSQSFAYVREKPHKIMVKTRG